MRLACFVLAVSLCIALPARARADASPVATPTAVPEPPPSFGRVAYRASKAASFESLGVAMIACRHRDPQPRRIGVEFFDYLGRKVALFGPGVAFPWPPGKKIVFVSDNTYFLGREVIDMRVSHFSEGTARIISDARIIRCLAKMRFDPGARAKSYLRGVGLYREGVGATPVPVQW